MQACASFCVIYRFRVRPEMADPFVSAWSRLTHAIRERHGGLGSRLHLGDDGVWVAYAQWPSRETWERARQLATPDPDASEVMAAAIEERLPPLYLEPRIDLLEDCEVGPAS